MTVTGEALKLRLELRQLMEEHQVFPQSSPALPLAAASECPQILEGYAMTPHLDAQRMRFKPHVFGLVSARRTPLLFRHNENEVAGTIEELKWTAEGALFVRALVDHPLARRCNGFSVSGRILKYRLHNTGSKDFHAEILDAELAEISLTGKPANRHAVVTYRQSSIYTPVQRSVANLQDLIAQLTRTLASTAAPVTPSAPAMVQRKARPQRGDFLIGGCFSTASINVPEPSNSPKIERDRPRRPMSSFSSMAMELNRRSQMEA